MRVIFFFLNDTATTEISTLPLHDALPIYVVGDVDEHRAAEVARGEPADQLDPVPQRERLDEPLDRLGVDGQREEDRKSTRLNSSHANISYAVFCLKKKKKNEIIIVWRSTT